MSKEKDSTPVMTVLSRLQTAAPMVRQLHRTQVWGWLVRGSDAQHSLIARGLRQPRGRSRPGGMNLAPQTALETAQESQAGTSLLKSALFTAGFCGTTFVGAAIWQYETLRSRLGQRSWTDWVHKQWNEMEGWQHKQGDIRKEINKWWNNLTEGQKVFWPICFINTVVFACWNNPSFQRTMLKYFCSNPAARAVCWPMFLSTFSHFAFFHLAMNMYVLHSFSTGVCASLGKEQFLAMYLSGGVVSSLASHVFKVAMRCPGPSLGASGAIMALLGYFCTQNPNAQLGIVFIPGISFSADSALKAVMCLDAVGIALGWRTFDHAAHLGGALFGLLYALYGTKHIWGNREPIMRQWHEIRNKASERVEGRSKDE